MNDGIDAIIITRNMSLRQGLDVFGVSSNSDEKPA
jgi:hypothetical protein